MGLNNSIGQQAVRSSSKVVLRTGKGCAVLSGWQVPSCAPDKVLQIVSKLGLYCITLSFTKQNGNNLLIAGFSEQQYFRLIIFNALFTLNAFY